MAIDFTLSPEHEAIRGRVREFINEVVKPAEAEIEGHGDGPALEGKQRVERLISLRKKAHKQGLWLPHMPVEWGGMGLGHVALAMVQAEAAKSYYGPWVLNCQAPDEGNMHTLLHWATPAQAEKYLKPLCQGTVWSCFAMTEPEVAGSDPTSDPQQRLPRRRGMGSQRPQVVYLQRPSCQLRHPDRSDRRRPGSPSGG